MAGKFINIYFGPWQMRKTSIRKNEVVSLFNHPRGYKHGDIKWQKYEWTAMKDNAKSFGFPSMAIPAITLRNTDLRELPTHEYRFSEPTPDPKANPFDYFQSSLFTARYASPAGSRHIGQALVLCGMPCCRRLG